MKKSFLLPALLLCGLSAAHATVATVSADAHVCSALPSTNFGNRSNLEVSSSCTAYLSFALNLPSGTTSSQVAKATMYVWVNRVYTTGTMSVAALSTAFTEGNVTYNTRPTAGTAFTTAPVNTGGAYVAVDVTLTVQGWVSGTTNNGLALTSTGDALLDSKENDLTGHAAYLDITLASQGAQGTAATVSVGTVTTGAAGSSASVTNSGTSSAAVLNFSIPTGATGPAGSVGSVSVTNNNGATGSASVSGSALTINFPTGTGGTVYAPFGGSGTLNVTSNALVSIPLGSILTLPRATTLGQTLYIVISNPTSSATSTSLTVTRQSTDTITEGAQTPYAAGQTQAQTFNSFTLVSNGAGIWFVTTAN